MDFELIRNNNFEREVPNPNYNPRAKKNKQPKTIKVKDYNQDNYGFAEEDNMASEVLLNSTPRDAKEMEKYHKYGINYNTYDNLNNKLADAQSNWTKAFNMLVQTASDVIVGGVKSGFDVLDFMSSKIFHLTEDDYSNPIGDKLDDVQNYVREELAPIYAQENGVTFGYIMQQLPSVFSSLSMLLPTRGISSLVGLVGKTLRVNKAINNTRKWITQVDKLEKGPLKDLRLALNYEGNLRKINYGAKNISEGIMMRAMENYQEARDVKNETYSEALEKFDSMTDEEFKNWVNTNKDILDLKDTSDISKDDAAKKIAIKAADKTFKMDWANVLFDIYQLHSLKNVGAGVKKATGRLIEKEEQIAKNNAKNFANKLKREKLIKEGKEVEANSIKDIEIKELTLKDRIKEYGKELLKESGGEVTEGVEEAINYIAQQEGSTYGKQLLEGKDNNKNGFIDSWFNLQTSLSEYMISPELWESAFWGALGGVVFQAGGNILNKAQLANARRKEEKELAKRDASSNSDNESINSWWHHFFQTEQEAAMEQIKLKQVRLENFYNSKSLIDSNKNPFEGKDNQGNYKEFTNDIEKQLAYKRLEDEYFANITMDAISSGTYDLLVDYFKSDEVKDAMIQLGINTKDEIDGYTQNVLGKIENFKNIYKEESVKAINAVSRINGSFENKLSVPANYAQIIAKENATHRIEINSLNDRSRIMEGYIAEQENSILEAISEPFKAAARENLNQTKTLARLVLLSDSYDRLQADIDAINNSDDLSPLDKKYQTRIKKIQQENILAQLKNINYTSGSLPIATSGIIASLAQNSTYSKTLTGYEHVDKEITKDNVLDFVKNVLGDVEEDADTIMQHAAKVTSDLNTLINKNNSNPLYNGGSLLNTSKELFNTYVELGAIETNKLTIASQINTTQSQISERIDVIHNRLNKARAKVIDDAHDTLVDMAAKYAGVGDINSHIGEVIIAAYDQNIEKAKEIANEYLEPEDASRLIDAVKVFKFTQASNDRLLELMTKSINITNNLSNRDISTDDTSNTKTTEPDTPNEENVLDLTTPTEKNNEVDEYSENEEEIDQNNEQENQTNESPIVKRIKAQVNINASGKVASIKQGNSNKSNAEIIVRENETIELDISKSRPSAKQKLRDSNLFYTNGVIWTNPIEIVQNPTLEKNATGYSLLKPGVIKNITAEETQNIEQPNVEENNVEENNVEVSAENTPVEETISQQTSSTGVLEQTEETSTQNIDNQEEETINQNDESFDAAEVEIANIIHQVIQATGINIFDFNTTVESIEKYFENKHNREVIKNNVVNNLPGTFNLTDEQINNIILKNIEQIKDLVRTFNSSSDNVIKAASVVEMHAKHVEDVTVKLPSEKEASIKTMIDAFSECSVIPIIDGQQIINKDSLYSLCKQVCNSDNNADHMFNMILNYLIRQNNDAKNKNQKQPYIFTTNVKNEVSLTIEGSVSKSIQRIPITAYYKYLQSIENEKVRNNAINDFQKAISSLKVGDKLIVESGLVSNAKNVIVIHAQSGDQLITIGELPVPHVDEKTGTLWISNQGWVTDVTHDGNVVQSKTKNAIIKLLDLNSANTHNPDAIDIRNILFKAGLPNSNKKSLLNQFEKIPSVKQLIKDSIDQYKNRPKGKLRGNNVLYVEENQGKYSVNTENVFNHLVSLWNYFALNNIGTNKEKTISLINESINDWFNKLYIEYVSIKDAYISENKQEATVYSISPGKILTDSNITNTNNFETYANSLNFVDDVVSNYDEIEFAISQQGMLLLSNGETMPPLINNDTFTELKDGNTYMIVRRNGKPYIIKAVPAYSFDINSEGKRIIEKNNPVVKLISSQLQQSIKTIKDRINNTNDSNEKVSLLKELRMSFEKLIGNKEGTADCLFNGYYKDENGVTYSFYIENSKNPKGFQLTVKVVDSNGIKHFTNVTIFVGSNGALSAYSNNIENIKDFINFDFYKSGSKALEFIFDKICLYSQVKFNKSDMKRQGSYRFQLFDDSIVPYNKDTMRYESYKDFLIKNKLVKINLNKEKSSGDIFQTTPNEKGDLASTIYMELGYDTNTKNVDIIENEPKLEGTDDETFEAIKDVINNTTDDENASIAVIKKAFSDIVNGEKFINDLIEANSNEETSGILDELLPKHLKYEPTFNYKQNGNIRGRIATVRRWQGSDNKDHKPNMIDSGIDKNDPDKNKKPRYFASTRVGSIFVSLMSGSFARRKQGIQKLIHESIHTKIYSFSEEQKEKLFNEITSIYNELQNYKKENTLTALQEKGFNTLKKALQGYKGDVLAEEFLVESLTSKPIYDLLNSIETTVDNEENKENLTIFDKLINLLKRLFGFDNIKDNSLLKKELNTLNNIFTGTEVTTVEDVSFDNAPDIIEEQNDTDELNEDEETFDETDFEDFYAQYLEEVEEIIPVSNENINTKDNGVKIMISNYDSFLNSLSLENKAKLTNFANAGELNLSC